MSKHDLEDTYLPAFRDAVVEGKVRTVMCVYNAINGVPGCAHEDLLQDALRKSWGFSGFVTGDCDAVRDIYTGHKYAKSLAEAPPSPSGRHGQRLPGRCSALREDRPSTRSTSTP